MSIVFLSCSSAALISLKLEIFICIKKGAIYFSLKKFMMHFVCEYSFTYFSICGRSYLWFSRQRLAKKLFVMEARERQTWRQVSIWSKFPEPLNRRQCLLNVGAFIVTIFWKTRCRKNYLLWSPESDNLVSNLEISFIV